MTLIVRHPAQNPSERRYILELILAEFLGQEIRCISEERTDVCIEFATDPLARRLTIGDEFLKVADDAWLQQPSLPRSPVQWWDVKDECVQQALGDMRLPVLYGKPGSTCASQRVDLQVDVFGSCFFLLSRYEELVSTERDQHARFPGRASIAVAEGFIDRPIVNEYTELLWAYLKWLWPDLQRSQRSFRSWVTCDVDKPLTCWARTTPATLRRIARNIVRDRSLTALASTLKLRAHHRSGRFDRDPNMTFDWLLSQCERAGHQATLYFICGHSAPTRDGCYRIDEAFVRQLLRETHRRGHQIGMHGSYNSYLSQAQLASEMESLRRVLDEEGIQQEAIGTRQHYLRWATPDTARHLEAVGAAHDSTLGFADRAGFRCGTCYEYPLYDLHLRRKLNLMERPLIVMEQSVVSPMYMGISDPQRVFDLCRELKNTCRRYRGDFVLLWHNTLLIDPQHREIYQAVLSH